MDIKLKEVVGVALLSTIAASSSVVNASEVTTDEQWMIDIDTSYTQQIMRADCNQSCNKCGDGPCGVNF